MTTVSVSPKFQVVIPKDVRRALNLKAGQRVDIRVVGGQAVLEPQVDIRSLRGFLPGLSTDVPNDPEGACWPGGCDPAPGPFWPAP
ncbi:AbrB/MazE/SpoVT family DNA-binding domain-containing protein [Sphaerotilus sp.]|uniref:AbrB/MazE/SpoVT family DNA-binding domain-containing protein n=1 Tax=Sphaerotilus sp. TaxID=2093942 RepID=UPI002ACE4F24|nr:AbrB/MazE/SpoVT family DNA-binding domain-containing protein [Sphaerotilus sp.]MDZ7856259.1 AbrB/MazE/SpoVT family DNA-binding domain-containing protein [Sphaerotilus sp.]